MLWIEFANSLARDPVGRDADQDRLEDSGWVRQFAEKHALQPRRLRAREDRDRLRQLRTRIQDWVGSMVAGQPLSTTDLQTLNRYLGRCPVQPRIERQADQFQLRLVPETHGVDNWLFEIASSLARFLVERDLSRLKLCDNQDCCWVFYDTTRSHTRRWCATGCGDLVKVREFRRRQRNCAGRGRRKGKT